jgi:hypothetical protein
MAEVSEAKLDKAVKSGKSHSATADALGLTIGQLPMLTYHRSRVRVGLEKKAPATAQSVKKLRDSEGNRWELIAARTGQSVAAVKNLYPGDPADSYTGRGRNFSGNASSAKPKAKAAGKASSRSSGSKAAAKKGTTRARTRAQRAAKSGNPS